MKAILDTIQANKELTALSASVGLGLRDLMYDQARLMAQDGVNSVSPGGKADGPAKQKEIGQTAVERDIKRVFWGVEKAGDLTRFQRQVNKSGGGETMIKTKFQGNKKLYGHKIIKGGDIEAMRQEHYGRRNGKGHVRKGVQGDELAAGKLIVTKAMLKRYIKIAQGHVGRLKSGFVSSADYFASMTGNTAKKIPAWVRKQPNKMGGQVNAINRKTGEGFIELINQTPYANVAIPESLLSFLESKRQKDINEHAIKRVRSLAKKHNEQFERAS